MKNLLYSVLFLTLFATGCNDVYHWERGYVRWINESEHTISMTLNGWREIPAIAPGESYVDVERFGSVFGDYFSIDNVVERGCKVVFDDGPYGGDFSYELHGIKALNPGMPCNYVLSRYDNKSFITYTFTNADYEAAVARGPLEDREDDAHWGFE